MVNVDKVWITLSIFLVLLQKERGLSTEFMSLSTFFWIVLEFIILVRLSEYSGGDKFFAIFERVRHNIECGNKFS